MDDVRGRCRGVLPLTGRLEPWQEHLLGEPGKLAALVERHGSPVNVLHPATMSRNVDELVGAAEACGLSLRAYFARKSNKALSFVDEARELGIGIDVASENELRQVLSRGVRGEDLILTAAVKPRSLLELAVAEGVMVAVDNYDELALLRQIAGEAGAPIAVRLAPRDRTTRFGMTSPEIVDLVAAGSIAPLRVTGIHFHLDGYDAGRRVAAVAEAIELADRLAESGERIRFIDIGGGFPVRYLESRDDWEAYWAESDRAALAFEQHSPARERVYPFWQEPVGGDWLSRILRSELGGGETVASALRRRGIELRCEPGRALMEGCGLTVARVEFRKRRPDGSWFIGVAMNRTQCRSTSEDFMVDPLLVRTAESQEPTGAVEGFLVGAYCIERELLSLRRLEFPQGVGVGDLIVFPNTAGYLMHILESASHQIPLAKNVALRAGDLELDPIEHWAASR